eukprot:Sspe_Gene.70825::Locus_41857_Transcript_1_3_Confidence_0.400_Length_1912::g.70825::m.70825/K05048/SLC6A15S; solute carrier family 6 (neurotransmitter transporter, amino acid/orphan) member 15/16/17/18/20
MSGIRQDGLSAFHLTVALLAYSIGMSNVLKFPLLMGKYGILFLLFYILCAFSAAFPVFVLELSWGQRTRRSTLPCLRSINPRFIGIGYVTCITLICILTFYTVRISYALLYDLHSFRDPMPWSNECENIPLEKDANMATHFFKTTILGAFPDNNLNGRGVGPIQDSLAVSQLFLWTVIFLFASKGVEGHSSLIMVSVVLPFFIMLCFTVYAFLQWDGVFDGLRYCFRFDFDVLLDSDFYLSAFSQVFFSLAPGMGSVISIASISLPTTSMVKVGAVVTIADTLFSVVASLLVFCILGRASVECTLADDAEDSECTVQRLIEGKSDVFLAYSIISQAATEVGGALAVSFYTTLLLNGMMTVFMWMETIVTCVSDVVVGSGMKADRWAVSLTVSVSCYLASLLFCTPLGDQLIEISDHYVGTYPLFLVCLLECILYSRSRTRPRVPLRMHPVISFTLRFISPTSLLGIILVGIIKDLNREGPLLILYQVIGIMVLPLLPLLLVAGAIYEWNSPHEELGHPNVEAPVVSFSFADEAALGSHSFHIPNIIHTDIPLVSLEEASPKMSDLFYASLRQ